MEMRQIMVLKDSGKSDIPEWERMRLLDKAGVEYEVK